MKLPTFQAQKGTSMASAMTSPAQVGAPKMRIAETKPLVGVRNVQGELNLGLQKSRAIAQIGKSVIDTSAMFIKVKQTSDDANNTAAQRAASSDRTNFAAALAVQLKIDANKLDDDGNRGFETATEDYERHLKAYDETAREKYRFSGAKAESAWLIGKTTEDRVYTDNIKLWVNDAKIEQTKALNEVTLKSTRDPNVVKEIFAEGMVSGLYSEGEAQAGMLKWQSDLVQTDMVIGVENLRRSSRTMIPDQFNANADILSDSIMNPIVPVSAEVQRKMLSDLSDMRIDYEERIMGEQEDGQYMDWMIRRMDAVASNDPRAVTQVDEELRDPAVLERFGESNSIQMAKTMVAKGTAGETTPEASVMISALTEDLRDGDILEIDMFEYLLGNQDKISDADFKAAYRVAGTVQDPFIASANRTATHTANMLFVKFATPSTLSFQAQEEKAVNIQTAYNVSNIVKAKIKQWQEGDLPGNFPDVEKLVHEEGAKLYIMPDYMRTSGGKTPANIWEIDINATLNNSNELYELDTRKSMREGDKKERRLEIESVRSMLRFVPTKPEGL